MRWPVIALLLAMVLTARAASTLDHVDVRRGPVLAVRLDVSTPVAPDVHTLPAAGGLPSGIYLGLPGPVLGGAPGLDGVVEKAVTLELARRVALQLPARLPVEVQLTRRDDAFLPIDTRIALASEAALFISLHANASLDPRMHGIEVFFGGGGP